MKKDILRWGVRHFQGWALLLCLICCLSEARVSAQEDGLEEEFQLLQEEEVVYSASKHEQSISDSPSAITVISREQIENSFCSTIACLLRQTPEVDVVQVSPMQSAISIRALGDSFGDKVLALLDGQELNLELAGVPLWGQIPVQLEDIERIEVIRGPGSSLYGANAYSGVISITTRKTERSFMEGFVGGGEHNSLISRVAADQVLGDWRLHLSVGREQNDSWDVDRLTVRDVNILRARVEHLGDASHTSAEAGVSWFTGPMFVFGVGQMLFEGSKLIQAQAHHQQGPWQARVSLQVFDGTSVNDMQFVFRGIILGKLPKVLEYVLSSVDVDTQANWELFANNLLVVGGNYRYSWSRSPNQTISETQEHRVGFFVQDEQRLWDVWSITGGARLDFNTVSPFFFSPRLTVNYRFSPAQVLRFGFGQAFRKPAGLNSSFHIYKIKGIGGIEEFFERSIGNEDLVNEKVTTFEVGYRGHFLEERLVVESGLFYNMYRDFIAFHWEIKLNSLGMPDLSNSTLQWQNTTSNMDSVGGSLALTFRIKESLRLNANYTYRFTYYTAEPSLDTASSENTHKGDRVPWEPAHLFNLEFHQMWPFGLRAGVGLHGASGRVNPLAVDVFSPGVPTPIAAYVAFSGYLSFRLTASAHWLEMGIRAYNAFNVNFLDNAGLVQPNGQIVGAERIARSLMLFLRGEL